MPRSTGISPFDSQIDLDIYPRFLFGRHLLRLMPRSVEMFLLLMPRSIEVFSPCLWGCLFLLIASWSLFNYPDQLKFFLPACGVVHSFFIASWNLLLIKSANFRVHSGIQSPS